MAVLSDVIATFADECSWQFKTNRWNCTGIKAPVYVDTEMEGARVRVASYVRVALCFEKLLVLLLGCSKKIHFSTLAFFSPVQTTLSLPLSRL